MLITCTTLRLSRVSVGGLCYMDFFIHAIAMKKGDCVLLNTISPTAIPFKSTFTMDARIIIPIYMITLYIQMLAKYLKFFECKDIFGECVYICKANTPINSSSSFKMALFHFDMLVSVLTVGQENQTNSYACH